MSPTLFQFIGGIIATIAAPVLMKVGVPSEQVMAILVIWAAVVGAHGVKSVLHKEPPKEKKAK